MIDRRQLIAGGLAMAIMPVQARPGEIWISPDGRDRGEGTFSRPFATLQYAIDRPEPIVCMMPGRYEPAVQRGGSKTIVAPYGNAVVATPALDLAQQMFRPNGAGLFTAELPRALAPQAVLFRDEVDAFGFERRLPVGEQGWSYDETRSEITLSLGAVDIERQRRRLRALCINQYNRSSLLLIEGGRLSIGLGIKMEGVGIWARPDHGRQPDIELNGCSIVFAFGNGLTMRGGMSKATSVRMHASQADCFNYSHDDDGRLCEAEERDCHLSEAGDAATFGSTRTNLNGSSAHSCRIKRFGGIYENSQGPDVADTFDADSKGQYSINHGVITRGSRVGVGFMFSGRNDGDIVLDGCIAQHQNSDVVATDHASVVCRGMANAKQSKDVTASITFVAA